MFQKKAKETLFACFTFYYQVWDCLLELVFTVDTPVYFSPALSLMGDAVIVRGQREGTGP